MDLKSLCIIHDLLPTNSYIYSLSLRYPIDKVTLYKNEEITKLPLFRQSLEDYSELLHMSMDEQRLILEWALNKGYYLVLISGTFGYQPLRSKPDKFDK